jgi:hypothetical protein
MCSLDTAAHLTLLLLPVVANAVHQFPAELSGGAIAVYLDAKAELTNITVGNASAELGGALTVEGILTCTSCHFTHTTGECA